MASMHAIDLQRWPSRGLYEHYRYHDIPYLCLSTDLDITNFLHHIRSKHFPFSLSILYLVLHTANQHANFGLRIINNQIVAMQPLRAAMSGIRDDQHFTYRLIDYYNDYFNFLAHASEQLEMENIELIEAVRHEPPQDVIEVTELRWTSLNGISLPHRRSQHDAIPKFLFGQYREENSRYKIPLAIEVHQGLVDGSHIGEYLNALQGQLDKPAMMLYT